MSDLVKQQHPGALVVPDFMKADKGSRAGFEQMDRADVILPRIGICQAMSPQRKRSNPTFIEGLNDGDIFNSVSNKVYGEEVELIPLQMTKSRILFNPLDDGGGIKCQSLNGVDGGQLSPQGCAACPNSRFSEDGTPPACNIFYNYPALVLPDVEPAIFSLKSSGVKVAKRWNARMQLLGDLPMFAGVYKVKVIEQSNSSGTFFSPVITFVRYATEAEFKAAKGLYESFRGKHVTADEADLREDEADHVADDKDVPF